MSDIGEIVSVDGVYATVRMQRTAMCKSCGKCGESALHPDREILVRAVNELGAKEGDRVRVDLETRYMLQAAFLVYIFPLLLGATGLALGFQLARWLSLPAEGTAAAAGAVLFLLSFLLLRRIDRRAEAEGRFRPRVVEIIEYDEGEDDGI